MESTTGEKMNAMDLMMLPPKIPELYRGQAGGYDKARATEMGARLKGLTPSILSEYQGVLAEVAGGTQPKMIAAIMLVRHEPIFKGAALINSQAGQAGKRLKAIPQSVISSWAQVTGSDKGIAATGLARCNGLFGTGDAFNQKAFDNALPAAQKLLIK